MDSTKVNRYRVLIIEDDPQTRESLKSILTRLECDVSLTETTEEAIEVLQKSAFDYIFAALCARTGGARSVARWVKSHDPATKFLVTTNWKGELEPDLLSLDGISDVIRKPLSINEIREKLTKERSKSA